MKCFMCRTVKDKKFFIRDYNKWKVVLHPNQCYLGRCLIIAKRHVEDLFEINDQEEKELFEVVRKLKGALEEVFNPNLLNYASLGNKVPHLHLHVIPRYERSVEYCGIVFSDKKWGSNPYPYEKDFSIPEKIYDQIISGIKSKLG